MDYLILVYLTFAGKISVTTTFIYVKVGFLLLFFERKLVSYFGYSK